MTLTGDYAICWGVITPNEQDLAPTPGLRPPLEGGDVQGLKYVKVIRKLLKPLHAHRDCHNRQLYYDQYALLLMLPFLNPTLAKLRSIQQATGLRNVQTKLKVEKTSLGSLSEAQGRFDPALLGECFQALAAQAEAIDGHPRPEALAEELDAVAYDGSLVQALPRMLWASWLDSEHRAIRLHLEFSIFKAVPQGVLVTAGNTHENQVLRERLAPDKVYVLDAGFAEYALFESIIQAQSSLVARVHDNAAYDIVEERELSEDDRTAGVEFDRVVRLGCKARQGDLSKPLRLVKVHVKSPPQRGLARRRSKVSSKKTFRHRPEEYDLLIATDLMDLPAEQVAMLFRFRWTIELFFRWFKCVLGFSHLLCESEKGLQILVYCALILSLFVVLWTGRKPTVRTLEMLQLYVQGWAEEDELDAHIASLKKDRR